MIPVGCCSRWPRLAPQHEVSGMPTDDSDFLLDEGGSHGCKGLSCGACILIGTQVGLSEKHPMVESSFPYIFLIFHSPF